MTLRAAPLAAALLLTAAPLAAQPAAVPILPDSGARVRIVRARALDVVGTLVARDSARWLVRTTRGDTVAFAPARGRRLDVSTGVRPPLQAAWRGARAGMRIGTAATAVAMLVTAATTAGDACEGCIFTPVQEVAMYGVAATVWSTIVGAVVGLHRRDRWTPVALPADARLGVVATPRGAGIGVRIALP